ncbi:hypothetical protein OAG71_02655 [bacterium]|nr:hypothetical protein [bacterium]
MPASTKTQFLPLEEYSAPAMPTQDSVRRWYTSAIRFFDKGEEQVAARFSLTKASDALLDEAVSRPAFGAAVDDLDAEHLEWMSSKDRGNPNVRLLVLPPCDSENVIQVWAERHSFHVLQAPSREAILQQTDFASIDPGGDGPIIIPRLEDFMVRHHQGLNLLRSLLTEVNQSERQFFIGCNAWAWEFLKASIFADKMLPSPQSFKPYEADRLKQWLGTMIEDNDNKKINLKFYGAYNEDQDAETPSNFYHQLAALSRGVPWVAWAMMRARLELEPDEDAEPSNEPLEQSDGRTTLWVSPSVEHPIPAALRSSGLLILHALLIHGPMTLEELQIAAPAVTDFHVVYGLERLGFVKFTDSQIHCDAAMYFSVRGELSTAGFPLASL